MKRSKAILFLVALAFGLSSEAWETPRGQLTVRGVSAYPSQYSIYDYTDESPMYDFGVDLRLMWETQLNDRLSLNFAYETNSRYGNLEELYTALDGFNFPTKQSSNQGSLMDLSHMVSSGRDYFVLHQVDRINLKYQASAFCVTLGRDAISWGNGLVFNPLDFLNPFAPSNVERDYKEGTDLLSIDIYDIGREISASLVFVPRKNSNKDVSVESSTFAVKLQKQFDEKELQLIGAIHYNEPLLGIGWNGTVGDALYRFDLNTTFLEEGSTAFSAVANIDYSWIAWDKNMYGFIELYYNDLGAIDISLYDINPNLLERLSRGEVFALGRYEAALGLDVEIHPLVHLYYSGMVNISDGSMTHLPRVVYNVTEQMDLSLGATLYSGNTGSEYGGLKITDFLNTKAPDSIYLWLKYYF